MAPPYNLDQTDDTLSLPSFVPSWQNENDQSEAFNQDCLRLGRGLVRDFEDVSFSSVPPPGAESTAATLDIGKDANATSTKRMSPQIPTRAPIGRPDFTMAAEDVRETDANSYEIGRGRNTGAGVSFDQSIDVFSIGDTGAKKNESRKRTGGRIDDRRSSSQDRADARHRMDRDRRARAQAQDKSLGSPRARSSPFTSLSFSPRAVTPKRAKSRLPSGSGDHPSKIKDYVSNGSGSGGSRASRFVNPPTDPRDSEEDALSDIGSSAGRQRFGNTRFQRNNASSPTGRKPQDEDLTDDLPVILGRTRKSNSADVIPKSFKSTPDFLKELGLDGHTQTINLQQTLKQLKDAGSTPRPNTRPTFQPPARNLNLEPSTFMIPNIPDMTDLFSGNEPTRFSTKKGAAAKSHYPIDSIPIPHDTRAMLTAMKLLQEKVTSLEGNKAANEQKCAKLESELRRAEVKYQQETRRARLAEEHIRTRGRPDSTFGGSEDGDMDLQEKARSDWLMEKLKLESTITTLQGDINQIQHELQTAKIALRNMQEERNSAINSVAMAISSNEDLKVANLDLHGQLEQMEHEKRQAEERVTRQREEYRAREERLRQYARDARQAAAIAEQAMREAARRDNEAQEAAERDAAIKRQEEREQERQEMERLMRERAEEEREEQRRLEVKLEFDRRVEEELRKIRPDLFLGRTEPFTVPSAPAPSTRTVEVDGRQRVIAMPRTRRSRISRPDETLQLEIAPESKGKEKEHISEPEPTAPKPIEPVVPVPTPGPAADDSTMSISPEEIRRIAKEINAERKKRKAAAATEKARQEEERQREIQRQREAERTRREAERTKREAAAGPVVQSVQPVQPVRVVETAVPAEPKKGRRVVKVVYMMDGDATEIRELEKEIESEHEGALNQSAPKPTSAPPVTPQTIRESVVAPEVQEPPKQPEVVPVVEEGFGSGPQEPATGPRVIFNAPPPSAPIPVNPLVDPATENHDPKQCTVCVRYDELRRREEEAERENPLKDVDNSCLFPAPELEPASQRPIPNGQFEEEPTLRPSVCPKTQLERVVRQLKDEFRHLKLMYQRRSEEFMELDPAIQKKKRKALTREMNELVAEMDAKSDQIYALYDVNEEFVDREKQTEYEVGEETEDLIRSLEV
ncbi:hypothetical protein BDD12DRAFT_828716 [Trichophaea hybrida]|nr:hypothetical protein BDD12DRAFT_828716 [Trichophaea hybrida]